MTTRFTAFRLYGAFNAQADALPAKQLGEGVVEIFYIDDAGRRMACLRWSPRGSGAGEGKPSLHLPHLDAAALVKALGDGKSAVEFRLDSKNGQAPTGVSLKFTGAALFEQYGFGNQSKLHLRFPVAPAYRWHGKSAQGSITIGHGKEPAGASYAFEIALPMPRAQTGSGAKLAYVFPFRLRYRSVLEVGDETGAGVPVDFIGQAPRGTEYGWDDVDEVKRGPFGAFGFSRTDGGADYIYLPRGSTDRRDDYWPTDAHTFVADVLGRVADAAPKLAKGLTLTTPVDAAGKEITTLGERWNSIGFIGGKATAINVRTAVFALKGVNTGDIQVTGDGTQGSPRRFLLRDPLDPDRLIDTGSPALYTDVEVSYPHHDKPWELIDDPVKAGASVSLRLGYDTKVDHSADGLESPPLDKVTTTQLLGEALRGLRRARLDLANIESREPQTFLPELLLASQSAKGECRFVLAGRPETGFAPSETTRAVGLAAPRRVRATWPGAELRFSLWTNAPKRFIGPREQARELPILIAFPGIASQSKPFPAQLEPDEEGAAADGYAAAFRLRPRGSGTSPITGRLGGLELQIRPALPSDDDRSGLWRFGRRKQEATYPEHPEGREIAATDVDLELSLDVTSVKPRGGDTASVGPRPILIDTAESDAAGAIYNLEVRERVGRQQDRRMLASLLVAKNAAAEPARRFVLLSEAPFSVMRFSSPPVSDYATAADGYFATYDSETRDWQLKLVGDYFHYELQAQAVGESMDRPRRLELYDRPDDTPHPARPYHGPAVGGEDDGVLRRRAVEFRLSPSAELWIRPTDLERNYYLPEWATRRLFSQAGALGLGATLVALRGEFLYGLPASVDPALEVGPARTTRVAEIEALLGRLLAETGETDPRDDATRWGGLVRAAARRPERLEFWMRDATAVRPLAPARFERGARFALRDTAIFRSPFDDVAEVGEAPSAARFRLAPHGLPGGAIWPLESANFARQLRARPVGSGGTIERIALSPGGGDADQRAEFLNGLVAITSETRSGHVQHHRVEIIGRISVLWHRAKHVVVYERTTSASAQFTPIGEKRTRRPVLRKVAEYIELLEPVRRYPDMASASTETAGFLREVRFNTKKINVDSEWSEEVGDFGWRIPLWNRASAFERPSIYPRPDVAFVTASEGAGPEASVAQECLDPDNLYFFANASSEANADTDAWPARIGIDLANLPEPSAGQQPSSSAGQDGSKAPSPPRIPRGHRAFTWRLAPGGRRTVINAGRGTEPVYAGLETLTFMRAGRAATAPAHQQAIDSAMGLANVALRSAPTVIAASVVDAAAAFQALLVTGDVTQLDKAATTLRQALAVGPAQAGSNWHLTPKLSALAPGVLGAPAARCEQAVADFKASIERRKLLLLSQLTDWVADAERTLELPDATFEDRDTFIAELVTRTGNALERVLPDTAASLGPVGATLETAYRQALDIIRDVDADVATTLGRARQRLAEAKNSYDRSKPWSEARIDEYHARLAEVRDGIVGDISSAFDEAQMRLATELDSLATPVAEAVGAALRAALGAQNGLSATLNAGETAASAVIAALDDKLGQAIDKLAKAITAIEAQAEGKHAAVFARLAALLGTLRADLAGGQAALGALAKEVEAGRLSLDAALALARERLVAIAQLITAEIAAARAAIEGIADDSFGAAKKALIDAVVTFGAIGAALVAQLAHWGTRPDELVKQLVGRIDGQLSAAAARAQGITADAAMAAEKARGVAQAALKDLAALTAPHAVRQIVVKSVIRPAYETLFPPDAFSFFVELTERQAELRRRVAQAMDLFAHRLDELDQHAATELAAIQSTASQICNEIGAGLDAAYARIAAAASAFDTGAQELIKRIDQALGDIAALRELGETLVNDVGNLTQSLETSYAAAGAYAERVFDEVGKITSGGLAAAPSKILRLYAAAASAPALPNLDFARERLGYYYSELNRVVDITPVEAWFGRLGDELKALGLSLPVSRLGDGLIPDDLSRLDIGRVFRNFGGADLTRLFQGVKLPAGAKDAIKITHAFDKKLLRAWVQIDIDVPLPGRKPLFAIGPFQLVLVDSRLIGRLRLEATAQGDRVEQTGEASLLTNIDAVVAGQSMVMLQKVALSYGRGGGLKVVFDPKNIRLNPAFRFIQETLAELVPETIGGLKVIKKDGVPVGVEHEFSMPPVSLMGGTSGVSNIQISNRFGLVAYPDFVITNRFALSRPEMPFLFSIFIIGGTGYIIVDCEYRPFGRQLTVSVEAAAGGSAALGFAAGPVSGSVFVTLSIALRYRKTIGQPGGGLTAALVLVIAGNVDVAGVATVYIGVLLRMAYHENGQIDGVGTLSVSVRISRFFKIKVRRNVKYKLRSARRQSGPALVAGGPSPAELARGLIKARGTL